ncbi:MAG TPA: proton-conducting transporter membrane subunit, partial [Prolixibacteraceae bacterium]|nr:proton-conducting transporter membrane subunit [Prolixibacteraceae bacterium]
LLFYSAGSVYQQTHTRNMDKLGGLIKQMPQTAALFLIGAIAIAGIPPFNGFISEFIIYSGLVEGLKLGELSQTSLIVLTFAGLSIIGGISLLAFSKTFSAIFLGSARKTLHHKPHEVSRLMLVPQYLIVAVMISVAFMPQFYMNGISQLLSAMNLAPVLAEPVAVTTNYEIVSTINLYFLILTGIVALIWGIRYVATKEKKSEINETWGCAYVAPNNRMQYTGKSFSKPFAKIFSFIVIEEKKFKELEPGE